MAKNELHTNYKAVVIGGSAGSFHGVIGILSQIPPDFPLPIILCLHRLKHIRNGFIEALSIKSVREVIEPYDKEKIRRGHVYLAPANYHMGIESGESFSLSTDEMVNNSRPAIDITFETAAEHFNDKLIGILLSGANSDGALGIKKIKDLGGLTIVQDPAECAIETMPQAALGITKVDHSLSVDKIVSLLFNPNVINN